MPVIKFKNILGEHFFDNNFNIVKKSDDVVAPDDKQQYKILCNFKNPKYFSEFRKRNIELIKKEISASVTEDVHINQAISSIEELNKILNMFSKRLREWYGYFNPEFERSISNNDKFVELVIKRNIKDLIIEAGYKTTMGGVLSDEDKNQIRSYARTIRDTFKQRNELENYLKIKLEKLAPNAQAIIGTLITAKLIEHAGSLRRLAIFPASTIQLLGAEKALFRHLKNKRKSKCPKFGVIFNHPLISQAKRSEQGKVARAVADKLSMALKIDYFKGKFIGDKLKRQLEDKFKK